MEIKEYANQSRIPLKILRWMVKKSYIENPLSEKNIAALELLENTWGSSEIIRSQLVKYPMVRRVDLLTMPDFETKWERYAYSRFRNMKGGIRLSMKQLIGEIEMTFGFTLEHHHVKRLYTVRSRAYNRRKAKKKQNTTSPKNQ